MASAAQRPTNLGAKVSDQVQFSDQFRFYFTGIIHAYIIHYSVWPRKNSKKHRKSVLHKSFFSIFQAIFHDQKVRRVGQ